MLIVINSLECVAFCCRKAQIHWDKRIHKSLNSMSSELGMSLAKLRGNSEKEELSSKWNELSNFEVGLNNSTTKLSNLW